jgi:hypothetical protein
VEQSEWTGKPIDGDSSTTVVCALENGHRRRLTIRCDEARTIDAAGLDVTRVRDRVRGWTVRNWKKVGLWALGLYVGSIVVPAATQQWSDRQAALALRAKLITDVSAASTRSFNAASDIARATKPKLADAKVKATAAWVASEGSFDATYKTYFDKTTARAAWSRYREAMFDYVALSCCDEAHRLGDLEVVHRFVGAAPPPRGIRDPWQVLECGAREGCTPDAAYGEAYTWLGTQVLSRRGTLLQALRDSPVAGFSETRGDFLRKILHPLP